MIIGVRTNREKFVLQYILLYVYFNIDKGLHRLKRKYDMNFQTFTITMNTFVLSLYTYYDYHFKISKAGYI